MIENVVRNIGGVGGFGLFSVCLFFLSFTITIFWAMKLKKSYLKTMQGLPLDGEVDRENHESQETYE
jgi:hypothetical protein